MPSGQAARIVGLGGSLAAASQSLTALRVAAEAAEEEGADVSIFEVRELDLPFFAPGLEPSLQASVFADAVYEADGLLLSSPMYHGTISGSFTERSRLARASRRPRTPVLDEQDRRVDQHRGGSSGASGRQYAGVRRSIVAPAWAVPLVIPISRRQAFDSDGRIVDERVVAQLRALGHEVAAICLKRRPAPWSFAVAPDAAVTVVAPRRRVAPVRVQPRTSSRPGETPRPVPPRAKRTTPQRS